MGRKQPPLAIAASDYVIIAAPALPESGGIPPMTSMRWN